jgi:hypothetical protein
MDVLLEGIGLHARGSFGAMMEMIHSHHSAYKEPLYGP